MIPPKDIEAPFIERLKTLYADMDAAYQAAADHYGFHCDGCLDNCCLTRFYHHTHLEYLILRQGFLSLPREARGGGSCPSGFGAAGNGRGRKKRSGHPDHVPPERGRTVPAL